VTARSRAKGAHPDVIRAALRPLPWAGRRRETALWPGAAGGRASVLAARTAPAFHAIKTLFPRDLPSDIGCYTLGLNLGAVDTVHCMGACISQGAGFYPWLLPRMAGRCRRS